MLLHCLVLIFAIAATLTKNAEYSQFFSSTTTSLRVLLAASVDSNLVGPQEVSSLYSAVAVKTHLALCIQNYYSYPTISVSRFNVSQILSVLVETSSSTERLSSTVQNSTGFLNDTVFRDFPAIISIQVTYPFTNYIQPGNSQGSGRPFVSATLHWLAQARYDMGLGSGRATYDIDFSNTGSRLDQSDPFTALAGCLIAVCLASLIFTVKAGCL